MYVQTNTELINVDLLKEAYYNNVKIVNKYKPVIMLTLDREKDKKKTENTLKNIVNDAASKLKIDPLTSERPINIDWNLYFA